MICFAGIPIQAVMASDYHGCFKMKSWRVVMADNRMGLIDKTLDNKFDLRERRHPQKHKGRCGPRTHHGSQIGTIVADGIPSEVPQPHIHFK